MKLTRVPVSESKSLSGEWLSVDVGGSAISESISISESQLELCGGKGVVSYSYSELNEPLISFNVMKTGGCVQNEIYSSLSRSVFMRWKGTGLVYLYNGDYEQIMSMRRIGDKIVNSPLVSNVVSNVTNINVNVNNNNIANSNVQNSQSLSQDSSTKYNSNVINNQQKPTTQQINQQTNQKTIYNQPNTQNQNQNIQIQNQNIQISNQQSNTPSITINTNTQTTSQSSMTKYSSISDLPSLTKTDLQGKWIIKDNNSDFSSSSYFFLILPDKIMLYGGCNVHFSTYTLNQSTLNNINLQSTSKSCP